MANYRVSVPEPLIGGLHPSPPMRLSFAKAWYDRQFGGLIE
jgi:hypothetical protein